MSGETGRTAFHWYSATPLTVIAVDVAVAVFWAQLPTGPHLSVPVEDARVVAQFTVMELARESVSYG